MNKLIAFFTLAVVGAFVGGGIANAYPPYPPGAPTVSVSDSTPAIGSTVTVTVSDCTDGEEVTFTLEGDSEVVTCADGVAAATLDVPTTAGTYTGTAVLGSSDTSLSFTIQVAAPSETIPPTGSNATQTTGMVALLFVALGGGLFAATRVRRNATHA